MTLNVPGLGATIRILRGLDLNPVQACPPDFSAIWSLQAHRVDPLTLGFSRGISFPLPLCVFSALSRLVSIDQAFHLLMAVLVGNRVLWIQLSCFQNHIVLPTSVLMVSGCGMSAEKPGNEVSWP